MVFGLLNNKKNKFSMKNHFFSTKIVCLEKRNYQILSFTAFQLHTWQVGKNVSKSMLFLYDYKNIANILHENYFFPTKVFYIKEFLFSLLQLIAAQCIPSRLEKMQQNQYFLALIIAKIQLIFHEKNFFFKPKLFVLKKKKKCHF